MTLKTITTTEKRINQTINLSIISFTLIWTLLFILNLFGDKVDASIFVFLMLLSAPLLLFGTATSMAKYFIKKTTIEVNPNDIKYLFINISEKDFIEKGLDKISSQGNWVVMNEAKYEIKSEDVSYVVEMMNEDENKIQRVVEKVNVLNESPKDLFKSCMWILWGAS
ncbi:hypothetical protein C3K47_19255 [Solitalea longa]|uniref:Uncharacterized protein n=1 Tax=Solitalea longa TaxID=2079460 RepID=A0A2S4ZWA5_9SPHI|nr:hypothetical protein [Solitalea longa]POY34641.1 hypothetical protein C3K47_19255 [Solitalea longa]